MTLQESFRQVYDVVMPLVTPYFNAHPLLCAIGVCAMIGGVMDTAHFAVSGNVQPNSIASGLGVLNDMVNGRFVYGRAASGLHSAGPNLNSSYHSAKKYATGPGTGFPGGKLFGPRKMNRLRSQTKAKIAETVETFLSGKEISDKNEAHEDDPQCDCSGSTQNAISVPKTDCAKLLNAQLDQGKKDLDEAKRNCNADINREVQEEQRKTQQEKDAKLTCMRSLETSEAENQKLKDIDKALALVAQKYTICFCLSWFFAILLAGSWWPELRSGLSNWQRRMDEVQQRPPQQGADGEHNDGNRQHEPTVPCGPTRAIPQTAAEANRNEDDASLRVIMPMLITHIMKFVKAESTPELNPLRKTLGVCLLMMQPDATFEQKRKLQTALLQVFSDVRTARVQDAPLDKYMQQTEQLLVVLRQYEVEQVMDATRREAGADVRADIADNAAN